MPKKKPYFPNNWSKLVTVPDHYFESIPFEQFMDWKIAGWQIPSSIDCIIREENMVTGKIKEYTYTRQSDARKRVHKIMDAAESNFLLVSKDSIHHLYPKEIGDVYEEGEYDATDYDF